MATSIRAAQLPATVSDLANITLTTPQYPTEIFTILSDNRTLVWGRTNMIVVSSDYGVTQTIGRNFNDGTWTVTGVMQLASGEVMVALKHATNPGEIWRSTGFVAATGQATSWAKVLTLSGPGVYARSYWGFNSGGIAPTWSRHAGAIWITEYGPQTDVAATPDQGAIRVYLSQDDGQTWRTVLDLRTLRPGTDVHLHMHGVTYDPWDGRLLISHGDGGNGTGVGSGGIFYSDNPTDASPTWTLLPGTDEHLGLFQVTTIAAFESGIISMPDGTPYAARLIPRRGFRRYGPVKETAYVSGAPGLIYIGARIRRNGGLENPSPGAPILMCSIEPATNGGYPQLLASIDGVSVKELYRHGTAVTTGAPGFQFVAGPTADGKIVASLNVNGSAQVFTADYLPAVPATSSSGGGTTVPVNVQTFTSNGTWTKPAGVTTVRVQAIGGGGGGGSGRVSASGTLASGGAGGSGGGYTDMMLPASACGATETITVGTGGAGAAAALADSTNGNPGSAGTSSTFGSKVRAANGNRGEAGTSTGGAISNNGGSGTATGQIGGISSATGANGGSPSTTTPYLVPGGGGGGGIATTPAATAGGNGGLSQIPNLTGALAGTAGGGAGNNGASVTAGLPLAGAGGAGGGSALTGAAGAGGNGGNYGAGGGGGGAALNGQGGSGAGGAGAPGIVIVTSW